MIAAAPERRRGGVCVCVPRERAQRRGRGLATTAQRDASWMVDGGESGVLEGGPSIDFSAGEGRMGRFRSRSDPCGLVAGHCSIALLVNDVATTTGLLPLMEGGRGQGGGGREKEKKITWNAKRRDGKGMNFTGKWQAVDLSGTQGHLICLPPSLSSSPWHRPYVEEKGRCS